MFKKLFKVLILTVMLSGVAFAYDFEYSGATYTIDESLKSKADLFIRKKVGSRALALKYLKALAKIDKSRLDARKTALLSYLIAEIEKISGAGTPSPSAPPAPATALTPVTPSAPDPSQTIRRNYQVNRSIPIPENTIPNTPRSDTTNALDSARKELIGKIKAITKEYAEVDDRFEFAEYGTKYLVNVDARYVVDFKIPIESYKSLPRIGNEILLKKGDSFYISKGGYSFEKKLTMGDIIRKVKLTSISEDDFIFDTEGGFFYIYTLFNYKYYEIPSEGIYLSQYPAISDIGKVLLMKRGGKYLLVTNFGSQKLFPKSTLANSKNPFGFLKAIGRDSYFYKGDDLPKQVSDIAEMTKTITAGATDEKQKIEMIYTWITKNITYDPYSTRYVKAEFDEKTYLENVDSSVFSGVGTFKNRVGVCDGFSKLFLYMLEFSGVSNASIEIGKADVGGGVIVSHAWNRIGSVLYDSTWDIHSLGDPSRFSWFGISEEDFYKRHFKEKK